MQTRHAAKYSRDNRHPIQHINPFPLPGIAVKWRRSVSSTHAPILPPPRVAIALRGPRGVCGEATRAVDMCKAWVTRAAAAAQSYVQKTSMHRREGP
eukprot:6155718-Prymnesium_polylepis.1